MYTLNICYFILLVYRCQRLLELSVQIFTILYKNVLNPKWLSAWCFNFLFEPFVIRIAHDQTSKLPTYTIK